MLYGGVNCNLKYKPILGHGLLFHSNFFREKFGPCRGGMGWRTIRRPVVLLSAWFLLDCWRPTAQALTSMLTSNPRLPKPAKSSKRKNETVTLSYSPNFDLNSWLSLIQHSTHEVVGKLDAHCRLLECTKYHPWRSAQRCLVLLTAQVLVLVLSTLED